MSTSPVCSLQVLIMSRSHVPGNKPSYAVIESLLRTSHKYRVEKIHQESLFYLEKLLPGDIVAYDTLHSEGATPPLVCEPADYIAMATLTRELQMPVLRQRALYNCCQMPTMTLITGAWHAARGVSIKLSDDDLALCVGRGRTRLTYATGLLLDKVFTMSRPACETPQHCTSYLLQAYPMTRTIAGSTHYGPLNKQVIDAWLDKVGCKMYPDTRLCAACLQCLKTHATHWRGEVLGDLNWYFGP